ncbi:MAG: alanine--glyoxylate aminotransferase family protein [Bdellovibrionales bacterium]
MSNALLPYRLLTPGPVPLAPEVLRALSEPVRHHRTPEFEAVLQRVWFGLKWIFQTQQDVMTLTCTGSGAMEAALVNTLSPGDEIICTVIGKFGERWADMGERFGLKVHRLSVPWGRAVDLAELEQELKKYPAIKAVLLQAVETSTATMNPVREIAALVKQKSQALVMVDAITGLGAMDLAMDDWGLDVVVAGSQKAFMLPTGLAFIALSEKAWNANKTAKLPRYYFDLAAEKKANQKGQTYFSSANSHLVALDVVFERFQKMGQRLLRKRCELLAEATRAGGEALGLSVYSRSPAPSVTALIVPDKVDGVKLRDHLEKQYNVTVMGGQDQLLGKILRIGHLGYITDEDLIQGMDLLAQSLKDLGYTGLQRTLSQSTIKTILARGPGAN